MRTNNAFGFSFVSPSYRNTFWVSRDCTPVEARCGGCAAVSRCGGCSVVSRCVTFWFCSLFCIFDCRFNESSNRNLCADLNLCGRNLCITAIFTKLSALLYDMVNAICRAVISKAVQWIFTCMKATFTGNCLFLFVFLSFFILIAIFYGHVFIKSLVCFHKISFRFYNLLPRRNASCSSLFHAGSACP